MELSLQDPVLLQEFLTESEELLQGMDQDLIELESTPKNEEILNRIFRALHTIKGTSGFFGLEVVAQVGHKAEDVLSSLRRGEIPFSRRVMDALLAARDQLGNMLADIRAGGLQQYSLEALLSELEQVQAARELAKPPGTSEPGSPREGQSEAPVRHSSATNLPTQSMRVDVRKLDELMNLIGELVLERNRLLQIARNISVGTNDCRGSESRLNHSIERLSSITEELQATGLRTRMVPIGTVFANFPRLVRDISHSLRKEVELVIQGQDTEIDKTMVELIRDPLVHLVRNSLDHGIELPELREQAGKPRHGTISLEAKQEGDHILIIIADDGSGIEPARILRRAVEKGLVNAEGGASLSQREILDFIFLPGFSTVENATNLSGRGVGMDVVRSNLKKISGTVELDSQPGTGTRIFLRLPLTLAIMPVLLVQVADEVYALPLGSVLAISRFFAADVHNVEGRELVWLRNETVPLIRLQSLFATPAKKRAVDEQKIVSLTVGKSRMALLVDCLIGQESTVVKPLDSCLSECPGFAGTSVDGDGRVRLVLEPSGLFAMAAARVLQEVAQ